MYGAFDVVLYFVIIQLFWLLINLLLILYVVSPSITFVNICFIYRSVVLSVIIVVHVE